MYGGGIESEFDFDGLTSLLVEVVVVVLAALDGFDWAFMKHWKINSMNKNMINRLDGEEQVDKIYCFILLESSSCINEKMRELQLATISHIVVRRLRLSKCTGR